MCSQRFHITYSPNLHYHVSVKLYMKKHEWKFGEQITLWKQLRAGGECSQTVLSSQKLSRAQGFCKLIKIRKILFLVHLENTRKKEKYHFILIIKMYILFHMIIPVICLQLACTSPVFLSVYMRVINRSLTGVFSYSVFPN